MMKISFITLFPDFIQSYLSTGLLARAQQNQLFEFEILNLRDHAAGNYKSVDDTVYGGADGALIQYEPLKKALEQAQPSAESKVVYLSPQGKKIDQSLIADLKKCEHLILVSGRYAGIDQRFITQFVDEEVSIGDYVLSGGELPSLVLVEALSRKIEGVLGNEQSAQEDSFEHGLLEAPQFTKPSEIENMKVPEVLMSGDHKKIATWKKNMSVLVTLKKRKDLISSKDINWMAINEFYNQLTTQDKALLQIENLDDDLRKYLK